MVFPIMQVSAVVGSLPKGVPGTLTPGQQQQVQLTDPGVENQLTSAFAEKEIVASPVPDTFVSVPLAVEVPEPPALIVPEPAAIDALVTVKVTVLFVYVAPAVGVMPTLDTVN